jgi:hypothetical protein
MSEYIVVQVRKLKAGNAAELTGPALTYRYGTPLEDGDVVLCPGNDFSGPFPALVVAVGSDYQGYTKSLICRVAPDREVTS